MKIDKLDILTAAGIASFLASDVLFAVAGKKDEKEGTKAWYVPATLCSVSGVALAIATNRYSKKEIATLAGLSGIAVKSIMDYQKKIDALPEEDRKKLGLDDLIVRAEEADEDDANYTEDLQLYYLPQYQVIFWATPQAVATAELNLNQMFVQDSEATLYDFLTLLGIKDKRVLEGTDGIGWRFNYDDYDSGVQYITFSQYQKRLGKGITCNYISFTIDAQTYSSWAKEYGDQEELGDDKFRRKFIS